MSVKKKNKIDETKRGRLESKWGQPAAPCLGTCRLALARVDLHNVVAHMPKQLRRQLCVAGGGEEAHDLMVGLLGVAAQVEIGCNV